MEMRLSVKPDSFIKKARILDKFLALIIIIKVSFYMATCCDSSFLSLPFRVWHIAPFPIA